MKFLLTATQSKIIELLTLSGAEVYIVGGAIRDTFLGKKPKDLDFATSAKPITIRTSALSFDLTVIPDQKAFDHGIVRIVDKDTKETIDVATLRKDLDCDGRHATIELADNILDDLARRDLTINAVACRINHQGETCETIDPFSGREDLRLRRIRFVGDPRTRIKEDYLRMLRACRFTTLGSDWFIDKDSVQAIYENALWISTVSKERIRDEIVKSLQYERPSNLFRSMQSVGLLEFILPDLTRCIEIDGGDRHRESIFDHLLFSLDASCTLDERVLFRLSALLHDIGKPGSKKDKDGKITFYKHELYGTSIAYEWMRSLKFTNEEISYVTKMVRHHMWHFEDNTTDKAIRRWLQEVGREHWKDLIRLRMVDRMANMATQDKPIVTSKMKELVSRVEGLLAENTALFKEDLAINGNTLKEMGLKPGPIYKEIFDNLLGIVISEPERNTVEWLTDFVQRNYINE